MALPPFFGLPQALWDSLGTWHDPLTHPAETAAPLATDPLFSRVRSTASWIRP